MTSNFGGVDVVPLQGAIVVCYGWGGRVTTNFGGVDMVPLQGAIVVCYGWGRNFFSTLVARELVFAIWGLCWYNFLEFSALFGKMKPF